MFKKVLIIIVIIISLTGCSKQPIQTYSKSNFQLNTLITITLFEDDEETFQEIFNLIAYYEKILSMHLSDSELYNINKFAYDGPVTISTKMEEILNDSLHYYNLSDGLFDISIGPLVNLWDISDDSENKKPPSKIEIEETIKYVGFENIKIIDNTIQFSNPNNSIDLGGIAKGFIVDKIVDYLTSIEVDKAILDFGGNIYVIGEKDINVPFVVGIQNPFDFRGEYVATVSVANKSVVTSGIYERYFEYDNNIYHHIINPFTGYPEDNSLASVTIISNSSLDGDALSTVVFLLGLDQGMQLIDQLDNIEAIFINKNKEVFISKNLDTLFVLTDKNFTLKNK